MSQKTIHIDTLVFGGGVAGLWLVNKLKQDNRSVLLLENNALGSGQTICSQGIIHSGVKYALTGKLTKSSQAIKHMPARWQACLEGKGEIDLSSVSVLSQSQLMWSAGSLGADLTTFFASKSLASRVNKLEKNKLPEIFAHQDFHGNVYELNEPVLDAQSLVAALAKNIEKNIISYDVSKTMFDQNSIVLTDKNTKIIANNIILLAGQGNQELSNKFNLNQKTKMQLRPLHMSYIKTKPGANPDQLPNLFAHCMQSSTKPRMTISSYKLKNNSAVWYLGGDLAETGIKRDRASQNYFVKQELIKLFPYWEFDFESLEIDSFIINRAEAKQRFGQRPDIPSLFQEKNIITAWPTKLAFAPLLADMIMEKLEPNNLTRQEALDINFPGIGIAKPKWEIG